MTADKLTPEAFFSSDPQVLAIEIGDRAGIAFSGTPGPFHMSIELMIEAAFLVREQDLKARLAASEEQGRELRKSLESERADKSRITGELVETKKELAASEKRVKELEAERALYYLDPKGGDLWLVLNGSSMKGMINLYAEKRQPFVNAALMLVEDELRQIRKGDTPCQNVTE